MATRFDSVPLYVGAFCLLLLVGGCTSGTPEMDGSGSLILLDLQKSDERRLVSFYLGGYLGPGGGDPFEAGLAHERRGRLYLNLDSLHHRFERSVLTLDDANGNDRLEWEEFAAYLQETYYEARAIPPSLEAFRALHDYERRPEAWFSVDVNGVMTTARRRVHVPLESLRAALRDYRHHDERLLYPSGTVIIGEHRLDGALEETTAMLKRRDGFWDFVVYDADGMPASATSTPPRPLEVPTQCAGCHFGSRLFEPERSFPGEARPGPHGPRALHVDPQLRDPDVTAFFDEHRRRSDTVLGLYGTLFVAGLRAERARGTLNEADAELLASLNL